MVLVATTVGTGGTGELELAIPIGQLEGAAPHLVSPRVLMALLLTPPQVCSQPPHPKPMLNNSYLDSPRKHCSRENAFPAGWSRGWGRLCCSKYLPREQKEHCGHLTCGKKTSTDPGGNVNAGEG